MLRGLQRGGHERPLKPGDRVVVLGPGPIGLLCAAMARLQGAEVARGRAGARSHRLEVAGEYGCKPIVAGSRMGPGSRRLGVDGVVDAAGFGDA